MKQIGFLLICSLVLCLTSCNLSGNDELPDEISDEVMAVWNEIGAPVSDYKLYLRMISRNTNKKVTVEDVYLGAVTNRLADENDWITDEQFVDWLNQVIIKSKGSEYETLFHELFDGRDEVELGTELEPYQGVLLAVIFASIPAVIFEEANNPGYISGTRDIRAKDMSPAEKGIAGVSLFVLGAGILFATISTAGVAPIVVVAGALCVGGGSYMAADGTADFIKSLNNAVKGSTQHAVQYYDVETESAESSITELDPSVDTASSTGFGAAGLEGTWKITEWGQYDPSYDPPDDFGYWNVSDSARFIFTDDTIERRGTGAELEYENMWVKGNNIYGWGKDEYGNATGWADAFFAVNGDSMEMIWQYVFDIDTREYTQAYFKLERQ